MNRILKNILAVFAGWIGGSIINMGFVQLGNFLYPIEGVDVNDMEALSAVMPTLSFEYFIFPFLAHALGTFSGAFLAALIASSKKMLFAFIIGGLFLIGGIMVNYMITGPLWFTITDIVLAYLPMAWLGALLAIKLSNKK